MADLIFSNEARIKALKYLIEGQGFEVVEDPQGFRLTNGDWSPYYLRPVDPKKLLKAVIRSLPENV